MFRVKDFCTSESYLPVYMNPKIGTNDNFMNLGMFETDTIGTKEGFVSWLT